SLVDKQAIKGYYLKDYQLAPSPSEINGSQHQRELDLVANSVSLDHSRIADVLPHKRYVDNPIFASDTPFVIQIFYNKKVQPNRWTFAEVCQIVSLPLALVYRETH